MKDKKNENKKFSKVKFNGEFNKMREYRNANSDTSGEREYTEAKLSELIEKTLYWEDLLRRFDRKFD